MYLDISEMADRYCELELLPYHEASRLYSEFARMKQIIDWGNDQPEAVYRAILQSKLNQRRLIELFEELGYIE